MTERRLSIIGGGLAGSEAAWQAAQRGVAVTLFEMRPTRTTPAHCTDRLAELVCSNSLGSDLLDRAPGLLKAELRRLGSLILLAAEQTALPAGDALAVGREAFSQHVTERIQAHPLITVERQEVEVLPSEGVTVVATGPLTSDRLAADIALLTGRDSLHFYDAMAPIVTLESIDMARVFRASRYGRGEGDYINCPMTRAQYDAFVEALLAAERHPLRDFEGPYFEACLPIEVIAERGHNALAFGPLKPVGLIDPRTGSRPYAVVQLRQDDIAGSLYNLVGFQTNLRWSEQQRVLRMIPGLEHAEFVRLGQMHRNTYIDSPSLLEPTMALRRRPELFFAGQITGTEGYVASAASGYVAGMNAARLLKDLQLLAFPSTTMIGALSKYVSTPQSNFQPMKPNFGLLPPLEQPEHSKRLRHRELAERSLRDLEAFVRDTGLIG